MRRALLAILLFATALVAALPATTSARQQRAHVRTSAATPDPVIEWNQFLRNLQATAGNQPATVHPTYELAIMHAAIYDAVVSIDHSGVPYLTDVHAPRRASLEAAADAAAHDTLVRLYPALQPTIDQEYAGLLAQLPSGHRKAEGIRVGQTVAAEILARRANEGSSAPLVPFQPGSNPGDYQL